MKIYIDILIITNTVVTLVCLEATAKLVHTKLNNKRAFIASSLGGATSLLLIVSGSDYFQALVITIIKALSFPIIVIVAFKFKGLRSVIKNTIVFFMSNLLYTGIVLILWQLSETKIIFVRNYTIYFNVSVLKLTLAVIITYCVLTTFDAIKKHIEQSSDFIAKYTCGNYQLTLPAVCDTGNKLRDRFSGTSVVIFYCDDLFYHHSLDEIDKIKNGDFRLLPFETINGSGLIAVTYKGKVEIWDSKIKYTDIDCCVGITRSNGSKARAIFNPEIIQ